MREVMVSGLRKFVVRSALKMVVSWRSPWPCEKSQKMAMQLSSESVACVIFLCWRRKFG